MKIKMLRILKLIWFGLGLSLVLLIQKTETGKVNVDT